MSAPLLRFQNARIVAGGVATSLDVEVDGEVVVLSGDWSPVFALATGRATLASGSAEVLGMGLHEAVRSGRVGVSLAGMPVPAPLTVRDALRATAALCGLGFFAARRAADFAVVSYGLADVARRPLDALGAGTLRVVSIACAALGSAEVIAVERPFSGLGEAETEDVERALGTASVRRRLVVSFLRSADTDAEARLLERADATVTLRDGITAVRKREAAAAPRHPEL